MTFLLESESGELTSVRGEPNTFRFDRIHDALLER